MFYNIKVFILHFLNIKGLHFGISNAGLCAELATLI